MPGVDELDQQLRRISTALETLEKLEPWSRELLVQMQHTLQEYFRRHVTDFTAKGPSLLFRFWGHGIWIRSELQAGPSPSFVPRVRMAAYIVGESEGAAKLRPVGRTMEIPAPNGDPKEQGLQKAVFARQFLLRLLTEIMEGNGASDRVPELVLALDAKTPQMGT